MRTWCCWPIFRSAFALSNATYGSPRMTRELRDDGITIGRHSGRPADARECPEGTAEAALQTNDRQPARLSGRAKPLKSRLQRSGAEPEMGCRHLLCLDTRGLALPCRRH